MGQQICYQIDENQVSHDDFEDEVVVIHFQTGNYFSLKSSAASLWRDLQRGPQSAGELAANFVNLPEGAGAEIENFLENLRCRKLVVSIETPNEGQLAQGGDKLAYEALELEVFEDLQALLVADVIHDTDDQGWPQMESNEVA